MAQREKKYATPEQIAQLIHEPIHKLDELVRKYGMPRAGYNKFDSFKVVRWKFDWLQHQLEEEKARRNIRSLGEIADLFGKVQQRTINLLVKNEGLPRKERGEYDLAEVIPWYMKRYEHQLKEAKAGGEDGVQAKARLIKAQADLKQIALAKVRAEVINVQDAIIAFENVLSILRQRANVFPKRAAPQLEGLETNGEREAMLKDLINELLTELADIPNTLIGMAELTRQGLAEGIQAAQAPAKAHRKRMGGKKSHPKRRNRAGARKV